MPGDVRAGPAGFGAAVGSVARRAIATRARLVIIGVTVFLGLAVPVLMAVAGDPADRTLAAVGTNAASPGRTRRLVAWSRGEPAAAITSVDTKPPARVMGATASTRAPS